MKTNKESKYGNSGIAMFQDPIISEMIINSALRDRKIVLKGEVDEDSIYKCMYLMERVKKIDDNHLIPIGKREPIEIEINSPGGLCYQGLSLISLIETYREEYKYDIITSVSAIAMSMGFMILITGSKRKGMRHSRIMCHQPSSGTWGTLREQQENIEELDNIWTRMKEIITKYTKITNEQLDSMYKEKRDWFMWSEEALKLGVIDHII